MLNTILNPNIYDKFKPNLTKIYYDNIFQVIYKYMFEKDFFDIVIDNISLPAIGDYPVQIIGILKGEFHIIFYFKIIQCLSTSIIYI